MSITSTPYFTPKFISGCQLWLDAADSSSIIKTGSNITQWRDKSGSGNNATAVGSPTHGTNAVVLGGSAYFTLPGISANSSNEAFFMVVNWSSSGAEQPFFIGTTLNGGRCLFISPGSPTLVGSSYNVANTSIGTAGGTPANTIIMVELMTSSLVNTVYTNGGNAGPSVTASYSGGGTSVLGVGFNEGVPRATQYLTGNIYEVIIYNIALTTTQRTQIEWYLAQKWGLVSQLPQGHLGATSSLSRQVKIPQISLTPLYTQFSPRSIPGCSLWLDAADPTTISGTSSITAWNDKSGSGNNAIFTGTNPSYTPANRYVETSGLNQAFSVPGTIFNTVGGSLFIVYADKQQNTQNGMLYAISDGYTPYYFDQCLYRADGYSYALGGVDVPSNEFKTALNTKNTLIYSINYVHNTSNYNVTVNGTVFPFTSINGTRVVIPSGSMVFSGGWGGAANIKFNEILFFNSILTTIQREQVESYLAQKWGLTATLPTFPGVKGIPGCSLWLDGADPAGTGIIPSNGATLNAWVDKSGLGNSPTVYSGVTYATGQQNSLGTINLGSYTGKMTGTITPSLQNSVMSCFFVFKLNGTSDNNGSHSILLFSNPGGGDLRTVEERKGNFRFLTFNPSVVLLNTPAITGSYVIWFSGQNRTNMYARLNGTSLTSASISTNTINSSQYAIGTNLESPLSTPTGWNGYVAEMIVYNSLLSLSDQQQIEGYLAAKWGLQSSLPNTHPYYTKVPVNHINNTQPAGLSRNVTLATAQRLISYIPYPITYFMRNLFYYNLGQSYWTNNWNPYLQRMIAANAGTTATANLNAITASGTNYQGLVLAPNGYIYCIPCNGTSVGYINPANGEFGTFGSASSGGFVSGALAPNGNIYCVKFYGGNIGIITPGASPASSTWSESGPSMAGYYALSCVVGPDGNIYMPSSAGSNVGVYTPGGSYSTSYLTNIGTITGGYIGAVLAPNGKIYCIPSSATNVGIIDTVAKTFTVAGLTVTGSATGYRGGVLAGNGKIYCLPQNNTKVGVIDPIAGTFTDALITNVGSFTKPYMSGVLGPDGNIYCTPEASLPMAVINVNANTISTFGSSIVTTNGVILAPNGTIYTAPTSSTAINTITFSGLSELPNSNYCLSAYTNKL